jgi:hypothetical protein
MFNVVSPETVKNVSTICPAPPPPAELVAVAVDEAPPPPPEPTTSAQIPVTPVGIVQVAFDEVNVVSFN